MSELNDLQPTFDTLRATIPQPTQMAKNRAAFLQHAKTVTENESVRPLEWSAPAFSTNGFGSGRHKPMSKRTIIALTAAVIMVSTVLAQQIIQFYTHDDDDRSETTLYYNNGDEVEGHEEEFVGPSLEELAPTLPFTAMIPTFLPDGYGVEAAQYDEELQALSVIYSCEGNPDYGFMLVQLPSDTELQPDDVGASAVIETVQIGDASGQVVEGGWVVIEPEARPEGVAMLDTEMVWDNEIPMFRLNWQSQGMRYVMFSILGSFDLPENPACLLDKDTGITIAESLATYTP